MEETNKEKGTRKIEKHVDEIYDVLMKRDMPVGLIRLGKPMDERMIKHIIRRSFIRGVLAVAPNARDMLRKRC